MKDAALTITTSQSGRQFHTNTDELGLATFAFAPAQGPVAMTVTAVTADGRTGKATRTFAASAAQEGVILVRTPTVLC